MFESIKGAIARSEASSGSKNFMKLEAGNTYTVRLLPDVKNPANSLYRYYTFGWPSYATGAFIRVNSPVSIGQRCPISEERVKIYRTGTEDEKEKVKKVKRSENWLVNAYVVNDPVNPDNNGKVKIIRFGRQLNKVIQQAITGDEAEDFGPRIFDLSSNGCSLLIKVEKQGDYPTYVSSKFRTPKEIEGLSSDNYQKVYDSAFDLASLVQFKSFDEIKAIFDQHYHCVGVSPTAALAVAKAAAAPEPNEGWEKTSSGADHEVDKLLAQLES